MSSFVVSLEIVETKTVESNLHFAKAQLFSKVIGEEFSVSTTPTATKVISTKLVVRAVPTDGPIVFEKTKKLWFRTNKKPQILIINTDTGIYDANGNLRFQVIGGGCGRPDLVDVMHRKFKSGAWGELDFAPATPIVDDSREVIVEFQMKGNGKTPTFPFWLNMKDIQTGQEFLCDPQVGNDPP